MASIVCPSCGAPVYILNKKANNECSFCGTKLPTQIGIDQVNENIEEYEYDETKIRKWKRRADDAIQYGLTDKALNQYQAIYESAKSSDSTIEADSYSMIIKLRSEIYFDENFLNTNASMWKSLSRRLRKEYDPSLDEWYESFSVYLLEVIDEIEDKCEELNPENQSVLVESTYRRLYSDILDIVDTISERFFLLTEGLSSKYVNNFTLAALTLRAEFFVMMAKYLRVLPQSSRQEDFLIELYEFSRGSLFEFKISDRNYSLTSLKIAYIPQEGIYSEA